MHWHKWALACHVWVLHSRLNVRKIKDQLRCIRGHNKDKVPSLIQFIPLFLFVHANNPTCYML